MGRTTTTTGWSTEQESATRNTDQNSRVVRRWSTVMQNIQSCSRVCNLHRNKYTHVSLDNKQRLLLVTTQHHPVHCPECNDTTKPNKRRGRRSALVQYFAHWLSIYCNGKPFPFYSHRRVNGKLRDARRTALERRSSCRRIVFNCC